MKPLEVWPSQRAENLKKSSKIPKISGGGGGGAPITKSGRRRPSQIGGGGGAARPAHSSSPGPIMGWLRSRVVTFTAIRLRGPGFEPRPRQKFENENVCFRRTSAVVKACHPCRVRPIKTQLYKTRIGPTYPILL